MPDLTFTAEVAKLKDLADHTESYAYRYFYMKNVEDEAEAWGFKTELEADLLEVRCFPDQANPAFYGCDFFGRRLTGGTSDSEPVSVGLGGVSQPVSLEERIRQEERARAIVEAREELAEERAALQEEAAALEARAAAEEERLNAPKKKRWLR